MKYSNTTVTLDGEEMVNDNEASKQDKECLVYAKAAENQSNILFLPCVKIFLM